MRVLLFGGTDLTHAIATRLRSMAMPLAGVVYLPQRFAISYKAGGLQNSRHADMALWCRDNGIEGCLYDGPDDAARFAVERTADFALVAGWFHMVPAHLRAHFPKGCAGLHASLLPAFRGGAPLPWAILSGASAAGMTMFELGDGIDDGPIYGQRSLPIGPRTCVADLVSAGEAAALELITECLPAIASGQLRPRTQTGVASYSLQRAPEDGRINWTQPVHAIDRLIRAVGAPYPGAFTKFENRRVTIWQAEPLTDLVIYGTPGQLARLPNEPFPCVVTGAGALIIRAATDEDGESVLPLLLKSAHRRFDS